MGAQITTKARLITAVGAVVTAVLSYIFEGFLAAWGGLDPVGDRLGVWLKVNGSREIVEWTAALAVALSLYGILLWRVWHTGQPRQPKGDGSKVSLLGRAVDFISLSQRKGFATYNAMARREALQAQMAELDQKIWLTNSARQWLDNIFGLKEANGGDRRPAQQALESIPHHLAEVQDFINSTFPAENVDLSRHPNYDLDQQKAVPGDERVDPAWRQAYRRNVDQLETAKPILMGVKARLQAEIDELSARIRSYGATK